MMKLHFTPPVDQPVASDNDVSGWSWVAPYKRHRFHLCADGLYRLLSRASEWRGDGRQLDEPDEPDEQPAVKSMIVLLNHK